MLLTGYLRSDLVDCQLRRTLSSERRHVGGEVQHVVLGQARNHLLHQRRPDTLAASLLNVPQLPHDVAGRASSDPGNRTEAVQIRTVTGIAWKGLVAAARGKRSPLRHASPRH